MKTKVTQQRFNTIKRQLRHPENDLDRLAEAHGLKANTIRFIRGCKDYATYQKRTGRKVPAVSKAEGTEDSLLDSNLTQEQANAFLTLSTDFQTILDQNKTLERTLKARNKTIEKQNAEILELKAKLQNAADVHSIVEKARTERKLRQSLLSRLNIRRAD